MSLVLLVVSALCFAIAVLSQVANFNTPTLAWIAGGLLAWILATLVGVIPSRVNPPA